MRKRQKSSEASQKCQFLYLLAPFFIWKLVFKEKTFYQHLGPSQKNTFLPHFSFFLSFIYFFLLFNIFHTIKCEKAYFNQCLVCAAPKHWQNMQKMKNVKNKESVWSLVSCTPNDKLNENTLSAASPSLFKSLSLFINQ